jgi:NAD(P)-dependent dehydrogenase (short-subunit alcohol dehydrogenase family)
MDIKGAAAIVTGGASGLGEATARRLAAAGARVSILDFNADRGATLARELGVKFVKCDVTQAEQVAEACAAAAEDGPLRVAVNCAGTGTAVRTIAKDGSPHVRSEWDRVLNINLLGTFLCLTNEASIMSRSEPLADGMRGVIVNTASVAAFDGQIGQLAYSASKAAVVGMTRAFANELGPRGIRVNAIAPGIINTPGVQAQMEPLKAGGLDIDAAIAANPLHIGGQPDHVARAALFLCSDLAAFVTGHLLVVDGGATA